jgi:hypothetical protein
MFINIGQKYYKIYDNSDGTQYYLVNRRRHKIPEDAVIVPTKIQPKKEPSRRKHMGERRRRRHSSDSSRSRDSSSSSERSGYSSRDRSSSRDSR